MSRETIFGISFIFFAVTDFFFPHIFFKIRALSSASAYLICQSYIIYCAKAIPIWHTKLFDAEHFSIEHLRRGNAWYPGQLTLLKKCDVSIVVLSIVVNIVFWLVYISTVERIYYLLNDLDLDPES